MTSTEQQDKRQRIRRTFFSVTEEKTSYKKYARGQDNQTYFVHVHPVRG